MKLALPQPLDRVLQRLLLFRLFLPLAVALLGIFIISGFFVWQSIALQQESLARSIASRVADSLQSAGEVLTAAGDFAAEPDPTNVTDHLRVIGRSYRQFVAFHLLDNQRRVLLSYPVDSAEIGAELTSPVKLSTPDAVGTLLLTEPFISPTSGLPTLLMTAKAGEDRVIVGELNLQSLQDAINHGTVPNDLQGSVSLHSPTGQVIAQSGKPHTDLNGASGSSARSGLFFDPNFSGLLKLTTVVPVSPSGWSVVMDVPVFNSMRGVMLGGLAALLAATALAIALVMSFGARLRRSVVQPLSALNDRASMLAQGDFNNTVSFTTVTTGFYEIAELAGTFERAQQAILIRQSALQSSEKRFRAMAELLPDMTFELNLNRDITFANRTVSRMMGYTSKDFEAGMSLDRLIFQGDLDNLRAVLDDILAGKSVRLLNCRFLRRTRQAFPVEVSFTAMRDEANEMIGFRCVARDITERMKAEENLRRTFQLFTEGPVVVFRVKTGTPHKTEYVSPNVSQFGYRPEEFLNSPDFFEEIIHPNDLPRIQNEADVHLQAGSSYYGQEYRILCKDGQVRWMHAFTSLTRDILGTPSYLDWYLMDITERHKSEEQVQTQNKRLAALQTIGAFIENNADLQFTLQTIVVQILDMLNVDGAAVLRLDHESNDLVYQVHDGFYIEDTSRYRFQIGESFPGLVAQGRKQVKISADPDILAADFKLPEMARERFASYFGLPLITRGELKGVLEIFHRAPINLADTEWVDFIETLSGQAAIAIHNAELLDNLQRTNTQLIEALARALESRDEETEQHSQRLRKMTEKMARRVGLDAEAVTFAGIGALLHDIGKIGVDDEILRKPGKMTPEERKAMQDHPIIAERLLGPIEYLRPAMDIPLCHHERYDGKGYPKGLSGEEIPLPARIFTIADVWDALRFDPKYRDSWRFEKAARYLRSEKGSYFDPSLVDTFLEMVSEEEPESAES